MPMILLSTVTAGAGGVASMEFTGIPQTGKDLFILASARGVSASSHIPLAMRINGNTGTNYPFKNLRATTSQISSFGSSGNGSLIEAGFHGGGSGTASTFGISRILIPNYTAATIKSVSVDNTISNNSTAQFDWFSFMNAPGFSVSGAVTSLQFYSNYSDNLAENSTISLYIIS